VLLDTITLRNRAGTQIVLNGWHEEGRQPDFIVDAYDLTSPEYQGEVRQLPVTPGALPVRTRAAHRAVTLTVTVCGDTREQANARARQLVRLVTAFGDPDPDVGIRFERDSETVELVGRIVGTPASVPAPSAAGAHWLQVTLPFVCADPLARRLTATVVSLSASPGTSTTNAGDQVWPTLTVTGPITGTTTELVVGNSTLGLRLRLTGLALASGQQLTIDCAPGREQVLVAGAAAMDRLDDASRFFPVKAGTQRLYLTVVGGAGTSGTATYRAGWAD
jgi:hypothetical protein